MTSPAVAKCRGCQHTAHPGKVCKRYGRIECRPVDTPLGRALVRGQWECGCNGEEQQQVKTDEEIQAELAQTEIERLTRQVANGRRVINALVLRCGGAVVITREESELPPDLLTARTPDGFAIWAITGSAECRSCGVPVVWAYGQPTEKHPEGARNPVQRDSVGGPDGNLAVRRGDDGVMYFRSLTKAQPDLLDGEQRAVSHYAKCAQANQWRRRGKS